MTCFRALLLLAATAAFPASGLAQEPPAWFLRGQGGGALGYNAGVDTAQVHSGRASAYIESSTAEEEFGTLMQTFAAEGYRGRRMRLTGFLRTQGVTGAAGLWTRIEALGDIGLGFDNMMDRTIRGTTEWSEYQTVLDVPMDAQNIAIGVLLVGRGRVWADDFVLIQADSAAATTTMVEAGEPVSSGRPQSPLAASPLNLQFEN
jgi:hypothetical protein